MNTPATATPTAREAIEWAVGRLAGAVPSPRSEAEQMVGFVTELDRVELFLDGPGHLTADEVRRLDHLVSRRRSGEPLHYLIGSREFRHIELEVGRGVLVPRPETESLVEVALEKIAGIENPVVAEVGCGSGAVALSIAVERPDAQIYATEISEPALFWGRRNLERIGVDNVTMMLGDALDPIPVDLHRRLDLVVTNPPYMSEEELAAAPDDVRLHEPRVATVSGPLGHEMSVRIVHEAAPWLGAGRWLVIETWSGVWPALKEAMDERYEEIDCHRDLAGALRVAVARAR